MDKEMIRALHEVAKILEAQPIAQTEIQLLTPKQAAAIFGVCTKTLQRMRSRGLRYVQITRGAIRYRTDDINDFIEKQSVTECLSSPKTRSAANKVSRAGVVDFSEVIGRKAAKKRNLKASDR